MKILMADGTDFINYLKDNGVDKERLMSDWGHGYETCKHNLAEFLMPQLEKLAQEESYKADAELYESKLKMANEKIAELELGYVKKKNLSLQQSLKHSIISIHF